jgi:hyperosmotically inducible periplasmic protein
MWLIRKVSSIGSEATFMTQTNLLKKLSFLLVVGFLSATLAAQETAASRYDNKIQTKVEQKLAAKKQFHEVNSSVEDGIVTLTGTVDLYQRKLDAVRLVRKVSDVQGVRNLIAVAGPNVSDEQLAQQLAKKLTYVRVGHDNTFDYFSFSVKDGEVTITGQDRTGLGRDEAIADIDNQPGVKDVVNEISVEPASFYDEGLRVRAARAIYGDPVLSKYAIDPARPIRIVVANGHVTLYGVVDSTMDKTVAGIRAGQIFGAFTVENNLAVRGRA